MPLTKRQKEIFDFIKVFIDEKGYAPSFEEIKRHFGLNSLATVHKHITALQKKGVLKRWWNRARSIEITPEIITPLPTREIPLLGIVSAGRPIEGVENRETITVPDDMVRLKETFALKVSGNSMVDDCILDGDYIILEKRPPVTNGEVVVALIRGSEVTLKRFYLEGNMVKLVPSNPNLSPIILPVEDVDVQGVVVGILRKFR